MEKRNEKVLIWVGIVVVIIGSILLFVWQPKSQSGNPSGGPMPSYAPQGQTVSQFPQDLMLDKNASVSQSFDVSYSASTNQSTAQWDTTSKSSDLIAKYENYFTAKGWTVSVMKGTPTNIHGLYASTSTAEALVNIVDSATSTQVTVSYLTK